MDTFELYGSEGTKFANAERIANQTVCIVLLGNCFTSLLAIYPCYTYACHLYLSLAGRCRRSANRIMLLNNY